MGLAARLLGDGGIRRFLLRAWLVLVGAAGVVCALIAIPAFPGDHSTADTYHHAVACPAGTDPSPDCVSTGIATVKSVSSTYHPSTGTGSGRTANTRSTYQNDITLTAPLAGGSGTQTQTVTLSTPVPVADQLPAGTQLPVTMWRNSVIEFQALGGTHTSGTNPDFRVKRDKLLLAIGLPVAVLVLWLLMLSVYGPRVRRGRFLVVDGLLVVLAGITVGGALGGAAMLASITGAAALVVLAASWPTARLGLLGR